MTSPISDIQLAGRTAQTGTDADRQAKLERALEALPAAAPASAKPVAQEELVKASQRINETLRPYGVRFEFSAESRLVTRIVDQVSGDVIRQIPSEAVLKVAERIEEFQGLLLNEEA